MTTRPNRRQLLALAAAAPLAPKVTASPSLPPYPLSLAPGENLGATQDCTITWKVTQDGHWRAARGTTGPWRHWLYRKDGTKVEVAPPIPGRDVFTTFKLTMG